MTTINLDGVVGWDIEASEFASMIDRADGDLCFELNSPGGYVTDGVAILNKIRSYKKGKTTAHISYAASMMTQIALACDEVKAYDNGIFMIHNVQGAVYGDHNDMKEAADLQERMSDMLAKLYVKKTGKSLDEVKKLMDADTYLFGQEMKEMGFVDSIIDTKDDKNKEMALSVTDIVMRKAQKAMKEEKLSLSDLKENFKQCVGNCNMGGDNTATPTANSRKLANNSNKRNSMTQEEIAAMQDQNKVFSLRVATLEAREKNLMAELENTTKTLDDAKASIDKTIEARLSEEKVGFRAEAETRVREAMNEGVSVDVAVAMLNADTAEDASKLAIKAKQSNGATPKAAENKNDDAKAKEELEIAMAVAKKLSVRRG